MEESGLQYKESARSYILTCPHCKKLEKLYIRKSDGRFICWYCAEDFQGWAEYALIHLVPQSLQQIYQQLYGAPLTDASKLLSLDLDVEGEGEEIIALAEPPETIEWPNHCFPLVDGFPEVAPGIQYLASRGISLELAQEYGLRYSPTQQRVYFPMHYNGSLVGYQGRTILHDTDYIDAQGQWRSIPKILSSSGLSRSTIMFEHRLAATDHCILTEGPIDAIKAHLVGGNVATLGKAVSHVQLERLWTFGVRKVVLAFDLDAAKEKVNLAQICRARGVEVYHVELPPDKDLGALSLEEARYVILAAKEFNPASQLLIHLL